MSIQSAPQEGIRIGRDVSQFSPGDQDRVLRERNFGMVTVLEAENSEVVFYDSNMNEAPKDTAHPGIELHTDVQMSVQGVLSDPDAVGSISLTIPPKPETLLFIDRNQLFGVRTLLAERFRRSTNPAAKQNSLEHIAEMLSDSRSSLLGRHVDLVVAVRPETDDSGSVELTYCKVTGGRDSLQRAQSVKVSTRKQIAAT